MEWDYAALEVRVMADIIERYGSLEAYEEWARKQPRTGRWWDNYVSTKIVQPEGK
jgi:hypothetical protein